MSYRQIQTSLEELKTYLAYDSGTGVFTWLKSVSKGRAGNRAGIVFGPNGRRVIGFKGTAVLEHRLVWFYMTGEWPEHEIDHINHDQSDNRFANLRVATGIQNSSNKKGVPGRTSTRFHGISWVPSRKKWHAKIKVAGHTYHVGRFDTDEEAARAFDTAALKIRGAFAYLNFPESRDIA